MKGILIVCLTGCFAGLGMASELRCWNCREVVQESDAFCASCGESQARPAPLMVEDTPAPPQEDPEVVAWRQRCQEISDAYRLKTSQRISSDLSIPAGMGRGLLTIIDSPIEVARMLSWSEGDIIRQYSDEPVKAFFCSLYGPICFTSIMGPVCMAADVVAGTIDVLTFGYAGNNWWNSKFRSPYFWERSWWYKDKARVGGAIGL